jgi:hypothetical protein
MRLLAFCFFIKANFEPNEPQLAPAPPPIGDQTDQAQNLKALQIKACRKRPTLTVFLNFRFLLKQNEAHRHHFARRQTLCTLTLHGSNPLTARL